MKETEVVDRLARIETHLENYNKLLAASLSRIDDLEDDMQTALLPIKASKFLAAVCAGCISIVGLLKLIGKV